MALVVASVRTPSENTPFACVSAGRDNVTSLWFLRQNSTKSIHASEGAGTVEACFFLDLAETASFAGTVSRGCGASVGATVAEGSDCSEGPE